MAGLLALAACAEPQAVCSLKVPAAAITMPRAPIDIVPVTLGRITVPFMLDTGAYQTALSPEAAASLGLKPPRHTFFVEGIAGPAPSYFALVRRLRLGNGTLSNGLLLVTPIFGLPLTKFPVFGLLGVDILDNWAFDLDTRSARLDLYNEEQCIVAAPTFQPAVPVETREGKDAHVRFPVAIDGRSFDAVLDTGAHDSVVSAGAAARLGADLTHDRTVAGFGVGHIRFQAKVHRFEHVVIGGQDVGPLEFAVAPASFKSMDVIMGAPFLEQHRVFVSVRQHRLFFKPDPD